MLWRSKTVAVGTTKVSLVLMVTMIILIMLMSSQQSEAFAFTRVGHISTTQRIRTTRSQLYNNAGSSAILEPPTEPKPKIIRFKDKLKSTILYPAVKARQVKEFFDVQLPMLRYLWPRDDLKLRVFLVLSMAFMFLGKWFNVKVPVDMNMDTDIDGTLLGTGNKSGSDTAVMIEESDE